MSVEVLAKRINNNARSFGVALSACVVPAAGKPSFILEDNEVEFGVGIHGEPGIERREYTDVDSLVNQMFTELIDCPTYTRTLNTWDRVQGAWVSEDVTTDEFKPGRKLIVMVNGLGGTPRSELYGAYRKVHQCCESAGYKVANSLVGDYCTSLNMEGFSITFIQADNEMLKLWGEPVNTPALRWGC